MIENDRTVFAWRRPQGAANHLQVERQALRRPHQNRRADDRHVDTLRYEAAIAQHLQLAAAERGDEVLALRGRRITINMRRRDARGIEAGRDL
jgi:hypothetical protein